MPQERLHRFARGDRRFVIDTETCFCFECDDITSDVLEHYPHEPVNRIYYLLESKHDRTILKEVVGELEWLRNTHSILPVQKQADESRWLTLERGLRRLTIDLRGAAPPSSDVMDSAVSLLLARAEKQRTLNVDFIVDPQAVAKHGDALRVRIVTARSDAIHLAHLAGKELAIHLRLENLEPLSAPAELERHRLSIAVPLDAVTGERRLNQVLDLARPAKLAAIAELVRGQNGETPGAVTLRIGGDRFADAVRAIHKAGFPIIELDMNAPYLDGARPDLSQAFAETAAFYAERLLQHDYFRLEPLAGLFHQIHQGKPTPRKDDAGVYALTVTASGDLYPSLAFAAREEYRAGSIVEDELDYSVLNTFDDVGAQTTAACRRCWARNVCGGGVAAVHRALTGSMREPSEPWCDMQRAMLETAIAAFNTLSAAGVPFDRVYAQLDRTKSPSLFQLARAAFRAEFGMRPIAEADAEMLRDWETWNRASYFLLNERAVFIGNAYERELDATHPRPNEFEMVIVTKRGEPAGLLRVRTARQPGLAELFLYLRDEKLYGSAALARSLRALMKEAAEGHGLRRILAPAAPWEEGLHTLLTRCGFDGPGVWREALFTRSAYHDVAVYHADVAAL